MWLGACRFVLKKSTGLWTVFNGVYGTIFFAPAALHTIGKLGLHHRAAIQSLTIDDKRAIANCVQRACFFSFFIEPGFETFEDNNVLIFHDFRYAAFDISQALLDQRCFDTLRLNRCEAEGGKFVCGAA